MNEFQELYQELILDHNKSPRNFFIMDHADRSVEGQNPLCGDHYTVYVKIEDHKIKDISFHGSGCAISKASASVMSSVLKGKSLEEAERMFQLFQKVVTGEEEADDHIDELGKLAAFAGVAEFPMRVKCATLAWHSLHKALSGDETVTTTE
jgi:nitrogen fixation NifU-like protein